MMNRKFSVVCVALLALILGPTHAGAQATPHDQLVAKHAAAHGVPEAVVRRVIQIESRGNPRAVSAGNYGLMQIRLGTARAMGYRGDARGLLDADINMTYAVRYLAGAYRAARGNQAQAIRNYQRGYYYSAKAQGFSPYTVASATQPAAPDPTLLQQRQDASQRQTIEQQQALERQAAEQERAAQRQAALQARLDQQRTAEAARLAQRQAAQQERIARQQAVEQRRVAQRQAMLQQRIEREKAREQQRVEREQMRAQRQIERQQRHSSVPVPSPAAQRAAAGSSYAWYNPMRYFKHPAHQAHPRVQ
jgi:hypothetical protein